jgi:hypothetical protein
MLEWIGFQIRPAEAVTFHYCSLPCSVVECNAVYFGSQVLAEPDTSDFTIRVLPCRWSGQVPPNRFYIGYLSYSKCHVTSNKVTSKLECAEDKFQTRGWVRETPPTTSYARDLTRNAGPCSKLRDTCYTWRHISETRNRNIHCSERHKSTNCLVLMRTCFAALRKSATGPDRTSRELPSSARNNCAKYTGIY